MSTARRSKKLREIGLVPTIQRLAVMEALEESDDHPTADAIHSTVRERFPSISRATVYNTLDALTRAGMILRLTVDPTVARYDASVHPHVHFQCRLCGTVYDIDLKDGRQIGANADGHLVESIRTYAYGVCAECLQAGNSPEEHGPSDPEKSQPPRDRMRRSSSGRSPDRDEVV